VDKLKKDCYIVFVTSTTGAEMSETDNTNTISPDIQKQAEDLAKEAKEFLDKRDAYLEKMSEDMKNCKFDLEYHILSLMEKEPFFAAISRNITKIRTFSIPTAGVRVNSDGYYELLYNPLFMESCEPKHRLGVLKHEFYHLVFDHVTSRSPYDRNNKEDAEKYHKRWNISTDLAINSYLDGELPDFVCWPGKKPFEKMPAKQTAEWYYANLPENAGNGNGEGESFDDHDGWGDASEDGKISDEVKQLAKQRLKEMMKEAAENANKKGWGTIPADMQAEIKNRIKTHVDWRSILRYFIKTSQRANKTSTVRKINKRFPYIHAGKRVERRASIAIAIDQSGSVGDDMLVKFFSALDDLAKLATFTVIPFDTRIDENLIYEWKKGTRHNAERVMCGGTCFNAPTNYVNKENDFDGMIVLTDLQAPKPVSCTVPRMWMTDEANATSPYFKTHERIIVID